MTLGRHDLLVSAANEAYQSVWPRHRKMGLMFVFWPSLSDVGKSAFFAPGSGLISCASDCCCNGQASQTLYYLKSVFKKMAITYYTYIHKCLYLGILLRVRQFVIGHQMYWIIWPKLICGRFSCNTPFLNPTCFFNQFNYGLEAHISRPSFIFVV